MCACVGLYRQSQQVEKYVFELIEELKRKMKPTEIVNLEVTHTHTHIPSIDPKTILILSFIKFVCSLLLLRNLSSVSIQTPNRRLAVSLVFLVVSTTWLVNSAIATLKPWSKVSLLPWHVSIFSLPSFLLLFFLSSILRLLSSSLSSVSSFPLNIYFQWKGTVSCFTVNSYSFTDFPDSSFSLQPPNPLWTPWGGDFISPNTSHPPPPPTAASQLLLLSSEPPFSSPFPTSSLNPAWTTLRYNCVWLK